MMLPMLEACPGIEGDWRAFCENWRNEREGLPLYVFLGELADRCVSQWAAGNRAEPSAMFEAVEQWLVAGDRYVSEAAVIGFLEGVQNHALHRGMPLDEFSDLLGPEASAYWEGLIDFWGQGAPSESQSPPA